MCFLHICSPRYDSFALKVFHDALICILVKSYAKIIRKKNDMKNYK